MRRALGSPCRRKMTANPPGNFSIQDYGEPGYTEPCRSRRCWPWPRSWIPSGMLSSTQPGTASFQCSWSHTHVPRSHSLTIHRAYYLHLSPATFCCCCSCLVSNILGSSLKQSGITRLLYWTAATQPLKQLCPRCNGKSAGTTVSHRAKTYLLGCSGWPQNLARSSKYGLGAAQRVCSPDSSNLPS